MKDRDSKGKFVHGHEIDLLRDNYGRFVKKNKKKTMDISILEEKVDMILKKAGF